MTPHANMAKQYGYGAGWYYCPLCGFFDHDNEATYTEIPNTFKCEGCGVVVGPKDSRVELVDGVLIVTYGRTAISNPSGIEIQLGHDPFLPHSLNRFHPFPPGMAVYYRRYPDEVFTGVVVPHEKQDMKLSFVRDGESCRVRFSNWVEPSWRLKRASMPRGQISEQIIGKAALFVPKAGTQVELF